MYIPQLLLHKILHYHSLAFVVLSAPSFEYVYLIMTMILLQKTLAVHLYLKPHFDQSSWSRFNNNGLVVVVYTIGGQICILF